MATQQQQGGFGCLSVIGFIFIVLKLMDVPPVAAWSWWIVTLPFWGPLAVGLVFLAFMALIASRVK